ncbi:MAG TPA: DUF3386 family protein [Blastocatellia bacterium]|nr:DUF3386 family protein [Blastocatellia bacterium]
MLRFNHLRSSGPRILAFLFCVAALTVAGRAQSGPPQGADPEAWNMLNSARNSGQFFPANFSGATFEVVFNDHGQITTGRAEYKTTGRTEAQIEGLKDEAQVWLDEQINSILNHRRGGDFSKGDGKYPITFGQDDRSPAGRQLDLNDGMKSSYRIRNNQVAEVDRTMGGEHFTISILETTPLPGGKVVPRHFSVSYFDAKSGALKRTETFSDEYAKVGEVWFPASRRMVRAENGRVITRVIEFRNPKISLASEQAAR